MDRRLLQPQKEALHQRNEITHRLRDRTPQPRIRNGRSRITEPSTIWGEAHEESPAPKANGHSTPSATTSANSPTPPTPHPPQQPDRPPVHNTDVADKTPPATNSSPNKTPSRPSVTRSPHMNTDPRS